MGRLLLVEHDRLFGEGLALLLEWRTGSGSVRAGSLAEARAILGETKRQPDCALVDLDLPKGEGTEVLKELDGVPVVALIRSRDLGRQAEALGLGVEEVLRKGSVEKIAVAVERLIGSRSIDAF
jgi:DNA-binding NarL/FixJ family response regulator